MAHANPCGEIQSLIQASHIRFAIKRLGVTISVDRLNDAGVAWDIHKPIAIRIAPESVFFANFRSAPSTEMNRRHFPDAAKLVI
jgi:hypothetical protein